MTLNSVEYNTELVIDWTKNGECPPVRPNRKIGEFIDSLIKNNPEKCEIQPDGHTIYLPLEKGTAKAMSVDENGNIVWTDLEAVTRHPPINMDGTNTLLKITTESGREAIATKAKSFLVYEDGKIIGKDGSDLNVGDLIPIVNKCRPQEFRTRIQVNEILILDPKLYIFSNNIINAVEKLKLDPECYNNVKDSLPYDSKKLFNRRIKNGKLLIPNKIYPKGNESEGISMVINLSRDFGFMIGAFLAEGSVGSSSKYYNKITITNNNKKYKEMATEWANRNGIKSKDYETSVNIYSVLLTNLIIEICGKGSYDKRIPDFSYSAPDIFIEGLLDGYLCGDGCVKKDGSISVSSRSKSLIDGVSLLLTRFGIFSKLSDSDILNKFDRSDPEAEFKPFYKLFTGVYEISKFQNIITAIDYKQDRVVDNLYKIVNETEYKCLCGKYFNCSRNLKEHNKKVCKGPKISICKDTYLDPIISIEDYTTEYPFVYDLTVEGTRNMTGVNGFSYRDTFHYAGVSAKNVKSMTRKVSC